MLQEESARLRGEECFVAHQEESPRMAMFFAPNKSPLNTQCCLHYKKTMQRDQLQSVGANLFGVSKLDCRESKLGCLPSAFLTNDPIKPPEASLRTWEWTGGPVDPLALWDFDRWVCLLDPQNGACPFGFPLLQKGALSQKRQTPWTFGFSPV